MNTEEYYRIARLALRKLDPNESFSLIEPTTDDEHIALALLSQAGLGPWEDQAKRMKEWANEREERFVAVRAILDSFGISPDVGNLESQVRALVSKVKIETAQQTARDIIDCVDAISMTSDFVDAPGATMLRLRREFLGERT